MSAHRVCMLMWAYVVHADNNTHWSDRNKLEIKELPFAPMFPCILAYSCINNHRTSFFFIHIWFTSKSCLNSYSKSRSLWMVLTFFKPHDSCVAGESPIASLSSVPGGRRWKMWSQWGIFCVWGIQRLPSGYDCCIASENSHRIIVVIFPLKKWWFSSCVLLPEGSWIFHHSQSWFRSESSRWCF